MSSSRAVARRIAIAAVLLAGTSSATIATGQSGAQTSPLDRIFAAYDAGDQEIIAATFTGSMPLQQHHLSDAHAVARWLGAWQPRKAVFLLDLADVTTAVAPGQTGLLLLAGQRYVMARPTGPGASPAEDRFERIWHRAALGLLQRVGLPSLEETYLATLQTRRRGPATGAPDDDRLVFAYAIAAEQRCWNDRPDLVRAGAAADAVTRSTGSAMTSPGATVSIARDRTRRRACLSDAVSRFDAASVTTSAGAEARVRGAWMRYQLGRFPEALQTIEAVDPGADRELAYWAALFRGRIDEALGRPLDAERAYRSALAAWPNGQSAGVGLALTLFGLQRTADAETVALAVRNPSAVVRDPWWTYAGADQRFVAGWLAELRSAQP